MVARVVDRPTILISSTVNLPDAITPSTAPRRPMDRSWYVVGDFAFARTSIGLHVDDGRIGKSSARVDA